MYLAIHFVPAVHGVSGVDIVKTERKREREREREREDKRKQ